MVPDIDKSPSLIWPHRIAVLLAWLTFPLLWVGGLVTTYDAGMAVPDWPSTYGYNLFLYPWQTWVYGPWDLFIEHGHRLLAALVGLLTIVLCLSILPNDKRIWMRYLAVAAVLLVIGQGVLGGMRVLLDERLLAMLHGCIGPLFFALCVALATFTSPRWMRRAVDSNRHTPCAVGLLAAGNGTRSVPITMAERRLPAIALITTLLAYAQLMLGAQLRHVPVGTDAGVFRASLLLHLFVAALLALHVVALVACALLTPRREGFITRPAWILAALIGVQLALGCAAYVTNYGWPAWAIDLGFGQGYVVEAKGWLQAHLTTAHMATGSLILITSLLVLLRSWHFSFSERPVAAESLVLSGAAG